MKKYTCIECMARGATTSPNPPTSYNCGICRGVNTMLPLPCIVALKTVADWQWLESQVHDEFSLTFDRMRALVFRHPEDLLVLGVLARRFKVEVKAEFAP